MNLQRLRPLLPLAVLLICALGAQDPLLAGNRLAREQSPYLREHAHDPVDWYPWDEPAFARARTEGKPILLSIGYSACHWCHVMQRESFQDPEIAAILNRFAVCVKVDREERPDVDRVYIEACQRLSRDGCGWPLTAFLTPKLEPFFAGTYFPPADRENRRGFKSIALEVEQLWKDRRAEVESHGSKVVEHLRGRHRTDAAAGLPSRDLIVRAAAALESMEDKEHGGFGDAPKFPAPGGPLLLLRLEAREGDPSRAHAVRRLLDALLRGGIRDHLAGGFHRYSTDAAWKVPHFEKMLYDQAMLAALFLEGWQAFGDVRYREACVEILDFCLRDLRSPEGGFIAALDADTNGVEGLTYTWTLAELKDVLSAAEAEAVVRWCGATTAGNWEEGRNVLREVVPPASLGLEGAAERLRSARAKLLAARAKKPQPRPDTKVLAGWNGLMISVLARAGAQIPSPRFLDAARKAAACVEKHLVRDDGSLFRSLAGGVARHPGELSDHAALLNGWLDLHEATLDRSWLDQAVKRAAVLLRTFGRDDGRLVDSAAADVLYETQDTFDGAWPSGFSLAVLGLTRLGLLTGDDAHHERAQAALRAAARQIEASPTGACHALIALDLLTAPAPRVEIHGALESDGAHRLVAEVRAGYRPFVALTRPADSEGPARAVVCVGQTCLEPAETPEELRARLAAASRPLDR